MNIIWYIVIGLVLVGSTAFFMNDHRQASEEGFEGVSSAVAPDERGNGSVTESANDTVSSSATVDLSGKGLVSVPGSVFNMTSTEVLNISNNNLGGSLQAEVRLLQNLRVLDLSDNNFTGVPAEVGQLSKLEVLDLSNNPITGLPNEIGNLKNLRVLDLRGTHYSKQDLDIIKKGLSTSVEIRVD